MLVSDKLDIFCQDGCSVALGTFDGVHLGHQSVISAAVDSGLDAIVVTTKQIPSSWISHTNENRIMSTDDMIAEFEKLGVYATVILDFSEIENIAAENYVSMLCKKLNAKKFFCGFNYRFGKNAAGDADKLTFIAESMGLSAHVSDNISVGDENVSSTRIRKLLSNGEIESACALLGHSYSFSLEVIGGDRRGRTIGYPTINQLFPENFAPLRFGVYGSSVTIDGKVYNSITNVGIRPTFLSDSVIAETYICGFSGDLYGQYVRVELKKFIRGEQRFSSLDELKSAISSDIRSSKEIADE